MDSYSSSERKVITWFAVSFTLLIGLVLLRYYRVQIVEHDRYSQASWAHLTRIEYEPSVRGRIIDRYGRLLADNKSEFSCLIYTPMYRELPEHLKGKLQEILVRILDIEYDELKRKLDSNSSYILLRSGLSPTQVALIAELGLYRYGIMLQETYKRYYPKRCVAHVVGYIGLPSETDLKRGVLPIETVGKTGLELKYDEFLRGKPGKRLVIQDVFGNPVSITYTRYPIPGRDLKLTIDLYLQERAEFYMERIWDVISKRTGRRWAGAVIMMKPDGEILVLYSYPTYDPNEFVEGITSAELRKLYEKPYPLFNRATMGVYPPASTFKVVTSLAGLQEGIITPDTVVTCTGTYYIGGYGFGCFNRAGHGPLRLRDAIAFSCDYYFYWLGHRLGIDRLSRWASILGVGSETGIDLPGEDPGLLPTPAWKMEHLNESWVVGDTVNMAIGQGYLLVTPLQVAVYTTVIATGKKPVPHLNADLRISPVDLNIPREHLEPIREGMLGAVEYGTARLVNAIIRANGLNIKVAGKTGTCENFPSSENPRGLNHTWFTAFAPFENPQVIVTVFLEQSGGYGGQYAAKVAAELLVDYFKSALRGSSEGNSD